MERIPTTHTVRMRLPLLALALVALIAALWAGLHVLVLLSFIATPLRVIRRSQATQLRTTTPTPVPTLR